MWRRECNETPSHALVFAHTDPELAIARTVFPDEPRPDNLRTIQKYQRVH
jgi:hypothetical protein